MDDVYLSITVCYKCIINFIYISYNMRIPRLGVEEPVHELVFRRKVVLRQHRPGPPRRQHHPRVRVGWGAGCVSVSATITGWSAVATSQRGAGVPAGGGLG